MDLQKRKETIGASEIAGVLGVSRYSSPLSTYLDKVTPVINEIDNKYTRAGKMLEETIVKWFNEETGYQVNYNKAQTTAYCDECDILSATLDATTLIDGEMCVLEAKNASVHMAKEWGDPLDPFDGKMPTEYYWQVQQQMFVAGYKRAYLAVLIGGNTFGYKVIDRNQADIDKLVSKSCEFWYSYVATQTPPPPTVSSDNILLGQIYDVSNEDAILETTLQIDTLIESRMILKYKIEKLEKDLDIVEAGIKSFIGDNLGARNEKYTVKWSNTSRNSVDTGTLKTDFADVYAQCLKTSTSRRFTISENK